MLEAESWTKTGKLVRFSDDAELSRVIFRRASQEELQAEADILHQVPPLESVICTVPKSCPEVLSVQVLVPPFLKIPVPAPLVQVAPEEIARLAIILIFPDPAVKVPEAPPPIVVTPVIERSELPPTKVAASSISKVPLIVIAGLLVAAVIVPAFVPSPISKLPATVESVAGRVKIISSAEGASFKLP